MTSQTHDLIKHGPRQFECAVCSKTWQTRPKSACPGLKLYRRHDHVPLMTREQLGYMGYDTTSESLPEPVGCFYSPGDNGLYVMLYDSTQVLKSKKSRTRRVTRLVTEVYWPHQSVFLIQHLSDFLRDRSLHNDRIYEDLINEIANMIAHVAAFTPDEIASLTGGYAHLTISPSLIRRSYPSFEVNSREQIALASRAAAAYERQKDAL